MALAPLSAGFQLLPLLPTSKLDPFGADFQVGGFVYVSVGLSNELPCEAGSFSHHVNPHSFCQSEVLRLYFPMLEPWVAPSFSLPSCGFQFIHIQMWDLLLCQLPLCLALQPLSCHESSPPLLPVSARPTSLDECFFFNSLVVGLPYSLVFWLCFVFKFVVILLVV